MKIERPNAEPLTKDDLAHLDTLRAIVEHAVADGVITSDERDYIRQVIWADGEATLEELEMVQNLVWSKIQSGDLVVDWS